MERPRRSTTSTARRRLPIYGQHGGPDKGNLLVEKETQAVNKKERTAEPELITYLPRRKDGDGKWKHFFKGMGMMGVWGAGEGALELVLNYMRRRRPE